jgi:hypothetical protein
MRVQLTRHLSAQLGEVASVALGQIRRIICRGDGPASTLVMLKRSWVAGHRWR